MTPQAFIARWRDNALSERAGAQPFFEELCALLDVPLPRDPKNYCYEYGAEKSGGGNGWADVWKRGCFGWENKKPGRDLRAALKQLTDYALALENPPLLVVCDRKIIEIHTAFTGYPDEVRVIRLEELEDAGKRQLLRWLFLDPETLRPDRSTAAITQEVAAGFGALAEAMRGRGEDGQRVAHFLMQCLFSMFAEDEGLLPDRLFSGVLEAAIRNPDRASERIRGLFSAMAEQGGYFGNDDIAWFNGGLFRTVDIPPLTGSDLRALKQAADKDWRAINPTIFGTLFERGLDPGARAQLGAHYTDPGTIDKLIRPLVQEPLAREWETAREKIAKAMQKAGNKIPKAASDLYRAFLLRLENFRVLDPACGSGNFLYLALRALREIEKRARVEAAEFGLQADLAMHTGPHNILGLEINEYAAELARVTVWIGDIQWSRQNGYPHAVNPILRPLEGIERRDALLNSDGTEALWPKADVIVGNPPFLGGSKKRGELGGEYFGRLNAVFDEHVPGGADLVCYWFHKARRQIEAGEAEAAGLVATNSIRGGANRAVLDAITTPLDSRQKHAGMTGVGENPSPLTIRPTPSSPQAPTPSSPRTSTTPSFPRAFGGNPASLTLQPSATRPDTMPLTPSFCAEPSGGVAESTTAMDSATPLRSAQNDRGGGGDGGGGGKSVGALRATPLQPPLRIFEAWSDEPWVNDGAAVRVSLVGFGKRDSARLNGQSVETIHADLTAVKGLDLSTAARLGANAGVSFQGSQKIGAFDIPGELAREWLKQPNPNGRPNTEVLKPSWNGLDATRRPRDVWIIDFGTRMTEEAAALYEKPFEYVLEQVKPERVKNPREAYRRYWWRHGEPRIAMRAALAGLPRYIATAEVAKHRVFVWMPASILPDKRLIVIARDDDTTFGILSSRFHEIWSLHLGATLEDRPCYRPTTCFETFPFPPCGENEAIAAASQHLNALRENWLNPPEWVEQVITPAEEKAGFPPRIIAKPGHEADLKKRTLTNLYNQRPAWLDNAHRTLDAAVAAAYGWPDYTAEMSDEEILGRLLERNRGL